MKNYVQEGRVVDLVAPYAVVSGAGMLVGNLFAVANDDAASGAAVVGDVQGVFDLLKDSSTFAQGDKVYWDNTAKAATSTSTSNKYIGTALADAVVAGTVRVRLNGIGL